MPDPSCAILSNEEMYRADRHAAENGIPGERLMEAAGRAVAEAILARWSPRPVAVLCGPGNNGGDGFVVARLLAKWGWPVRVGLLGRRERLAGDARINADRWDGRIEPISPDLLDGAALAVDALFGAGLARPLEGAAAAVIGAIGERNIDCIAVDVPSGVHGDSGEVLGVAAAARLTVTFFRPKHGHLLYPGRELCGELLVADIGIPDSALDAIKPRQWLNGPALWIGDYPRSDPTQHKYSRGHALVVGGARTTGAARMAARAARRAGAGVVTVLAPPSAALVYRMALVGSLFDVIENPADLAARLADPRADAALLGPGNGTTGKTRDNVLAALGTGKPMLLDADALTVFADDPDSLFAAISGPCLMTPHEGEFARLFGSVEGPGKLARARAAAALSSATVLLKGPDTVVAAPDGRAAICNNAPPWLATAGAGDVLAGFAVALMAQGMPLFSSACCAAWLHGEAAASFGPGLIAEDLPDALPAVLSRLHLG